MTQPTVLIVDDLESVRSALAELLEATEEFSVVQAADGLEAIERVEEINPALVLMDVKMPVMDGVEATREIVRRHPGVLVIAHTAYQDSSLVRDMISAGAKGYILKGSRGKQIVDTLKAALEGEAVISPQVARPLLDDLEALYRREQQRAEKLASLVEQLQEAATTDHLTGLFNHRFFHEHLGAELGNARQNGQPLSLAVLDVDDFKLVNDQFGHAQGDILLQHMAAHLRQRIGSDDAAFRLGGDEFAIVMPQTDGDAAAAIIGGLCQSIASLGVPHLPPQTVSGGLASYPDNALDKEGLIQAADCAMYESKETGKNRVSLFTERRNSENAPGRRPHRDDLATAAAALTAVLRAKHEPTFLHCQRVSACASAIAGQLGLDPDESRVVRLSGLLHDLGKIGVSAETLNNAGPLDNHGWKEMREHPAIGHAALLSVMPPAVAECVAMHHEQPDGGGYPRGLKGREIPLVAGVVRVADAFDAMVCDRPFQRARTPEEALAVLQQGQGTLFDAAAVDAITDLVRTGALSVLYEVEV